MDRYLSRAKKIIKKKHKKENNNAQKSEEKVYEGYRYSLTTFTDDSGQKTKAVKITGLSEKKTELEIPEQIDQTPVKIIGKGAFKGNQDIIEVKIGNHIELIGSEAFAECSNLKKAELPVDLKVINQSTFENCMELEKVVLPRSVKITGKNAFKGCSKLNRRKRQEKVYEGYQYSLTTFTDDSGRKTKVVKITGLSEEKTELQIPDQIDGLPVRIIGKAAFKGNQEITEVSIGDHIELIGSEAFSGCSNLKKAELPADLQTINQSTFENCQALKQVILPYSVQKIGRNAFRGCARLEEYWHYMKRGISAVMVLDKTLKEENLPEALEQIGAGAFEGCASLEKMHIPHKVTSIPKNAFKDCTGLEKVGLHNDLIKIGDQAFKNCPSLMKMTLPEHIKKIGEDAFDDTLALYCVSPKVCDLLEENGYQAVKTDCLKVQEGIRPSNMVPPEGSQEYRPFYDKDAFDKMQQAFELKCIKEGVKREVRQEKVRPSRFLYEDGYYKNRENRNQSRADRAKIVMTGDLMCRDNQINAAKEGDQYHFDRSFKYVKNILSGSDLTIGNLESILSPSLPYSNEVSMIDDRVHLNAPEEYIAAVSNAGFDMVVNAQNHIYDGGLLGIYETLDCLNRQQLIHTGVFAGKNDKRYVLFDLNGIKVGVVSYMDQARQKMKQLNFTDEGVETLFSFFEKERIEKDISAARAEGAEFIIAYCHWGREFVTKITKRQERFAKMVAEAGADFLLGAHSHCLQPFSMIKTSDNRTVPVLYSAGNFLSNIDIVMPYVRDSLILELDLCRDNDGKAVIEKLGYHPCIIFDDEKKGQMAVAPISELYQTEDKLKKIKLDEDLIRIRQCAGYLSAISCYTGEMQDIPANQKDDFISKYEILPPTIARSFEEKENVSKYYLDSNDNIYKQRTRTGFMEAKILCTGQITYDVQYDMESSYFGKYEFANSLSQLEACFEKSDFVVGATNTMVSEEYPTIRKYRSLLAKPANFSNAPEELLSALYRCGFTCLAMSHPNNLGTGVKGLFNTEKNIADHNMISSGIGKNKNPVVEINGIKIAVLSYGTAIRDRANIITDEGAQLFLNEYTKEGYKRTIDELRQRGVEFILTCLNCGDGRTNLNLPGRKKVAEEIAEAGADYVICIRPHVLSGYYQYETGDGRTVPIASSIGTMLTGDVSEKNNLSAFLDLTIRKDFDGNITCEDNYIPVKVNRNKDYGSKVFVLHELYGSGQNMKSFKKDRASISRKLGAAISENRDRVVTIDSHYQPQITIKEIYDLLEKTPDSKDLETFGDQFDKAVKYVASRKNDISKGCVAVMIQHFNYQKDKIQLTVKDAVETGCILLIDKADHKEIPTIVVDNPSEAYRRIAKFAREKYHPLTVAITGTVGKTTTKDLMSTVFDNQYRTLRIKGNNNTIITASLVVQKLSSDDQAYIQEVHGGTMGSAESISNLIKPDICLITNIGQGHLGQMKTVENLLREKLKITSGMRENGVLILNNDNEYLREQHPDVKTIRYSSYDTSADYYAQNIKDRGNRWEFQIVSRGGEFDTAGVYDAFLNFQGIYNVNNAVGVFAAARQAGIPAHKIIAGLARYTPEGIRQNLVDSGGYQMLVDVYSCTPNSMVSAVETLSELKVKEGGRRIAILGDSFDQGDKHIVNHYEVGEKISPLDFDLLLSFGEDIKYTVEKVREAGKEAYFFQTKETLNRFLADFIRPDDILYFKSSNRAHFKEEIIFPLFGRITE